MGISEKMTEVVSYNTLIKAFAQRANYTAACEALREKMLPKVCSASFTHSGTLGPGVGSDEAEEGIS